MENENKQVTVEEFINNPENKRAAEERAFYLWNIVTNNANTASAIERIFTKSEIINRTTLTGQKLDELLEMFQLFGLIVFTKGDYEFKFIFSEELRKAEAFADIVESLSALNVNIDRYVSLHITEEEKSKAMQDVKNAMKDLVKV